MKRILAVLTAVSISLLVLNIPAYAITEKEFLTSCTWVLEQYFDGEITNEQYNEQINALQNEYYGGLQSDNIFDKIGDVFYRGSDELKQGILGTAGFLPNKWNEYIRNKEPGYMKGDIDMQGYGAIMIENWYSRGEHIRKYIHFMAYGVHKGKFVDFYGNSSNPVKRYCVFTNVGSDNTYLTAYGGMSLSDSSGTVIYEYIFIGDWRTESGEPYTGTQQVNYDEPPAYDEVPENVLQAFLNDLLAELERLIPDLSNLEGILQAIYNQTIGISGQMVTKDDLNSAILQLMGQNCQEEILNALLEIRDNMGKETEPEDDETIDLLTEIRDLLNENEESGSSDLITEIRDILLEYDTSLMSDTNEILNSILEKLEEPEDDGNYMEIYALFTEMRNLLQEISDKELETVVDTKETDLSEIVVLLTDIKNALENSGGVSSGSGEEDEEDDKKEIAGTLYNVIPLESGFWGKLFNGENLKVEYQGKKYHLENDGTLLYDGKYYNVDLNYTTTIDWESDDEEFNDRLDEIMKGLGDIEYIDSDGGILEWIGDIFVQDRFVDLGTGSPINLNIDVGNLKLSKPLKKIANAIVDLIVLLNGSMQYNLLTAAISSYQIMIFNDSLVPEDIKIRIPEFIPDDKGNYPVFQSQEEYVLISADIIEENQEQLTVIRTFTGIVITFMWMLRYRKQVVNMIT